MEMWYFVIIRVSFFLYTDVCRNDVCRNEHVDVCLQLMCLLVLQCAKGTEDVCEMKMVS
jgi:hypothetical protein